MTESLHRTKRAVYVVLLCIAIIASSVALYNQFASESTSKSLGDQVVSVCQQNRALALAQGLNCDQARQAQDSNPVIKGEKGERGEKGEQGDQGDTGYGVPGSEGRPGSMGNDGANGSNGVNGSNGTDGQSGIDGAQGEPGAKGEKGDVGERGSDGAPADPPEVIVSIEKTNNPCQLTITTSKQNVFNVTLPESNCSII